MGRGESVRSPSVIAVSNKIAVCILPPHAASVLCMSPGRLHGPPLGRLGKFEAWNLNSEIASRQCSVVLESMRTACAVRVSRTIGTVSNRVNPLRKIEIVEA